MSSDAGYMLIRVDLQGAREAAAEAAVLSGEIKGVGAAAATSGAASAASASKTTKMRNAWNGVTKAAKLGALGLVGLGAGIGMAAKAGIEETLDLSKTAMGLSRNLGITAREGVQWGVVAKARGIDTKALNMAFTTLSKQMVASNKDWTAAEDTFQALGITQSQVKNGTKDFGGMVNVLAEALGNAEGGAERQAAAAKLLGRGYQTVLPMFSKGAKGLQEQLDLADKYHVSFGQQMVDDNMELVQAQRESTVAWMGIKAELSEQFLPVLMDAHKAFQDFAVIMTDPKLSDTKKLDIITDKIREVARKGSNFLISMIPVAAERIGETAPKVAGAFIQGFLNANAWGKIAIGGWLLWKLGGIKAFAAMGAKAGGALALSFIKRVGAYLLATKAGMGLAAIFGPGGKLISKLRVWGSAAGRAAGRATGKAFTLGVAAGILLFGDEIADAWDEIMPGDWSGGLLRGNDDSFRSGDVIPSLGEVKELLGFASGGTTPFGGTFLVGERGPELATLPGGTRITPNDEIQRAGSPKRVGVGGYETALLSPDDSRGTPLVLPRQNGETPVVLVMDGKKVGKGILKHAEDAKARR